MLYDHKYNPIAKQQYKEKFISEEEKKELQEMVARRIRLTKEHQTKLHENYQAQEVVKK